MFPKVNSFFNECVELEGGDLTLFELTAEEIVGVAESFKEEERKGARTLGSRRKSSLNSSPFMRWSRVGSRARAEAERGLSSRRAISPKMSPGRR